MMNGICYLKSVRAYLLLTSTPERRFELQTARHATQDVHGSERLTAASHPGVGVGWGFPNLRAAQRPAIRKPDIPHGSRVSVGRTSGPQPDRIAVFILVGLDVQAQSLVRDGCNPEG